LLPDKENAQHFTGNKKCGGAKHHQGRKPDWCFVEPGAADQAAEQLPFVMCWFAIYDHFYKMFF
jgi:hypothetical protein